MKKIITFSFFLIGFIAMSAQIIFVRELLIAFYGNELSLGLIFSAWLFFTAAGSAFLGSFSDRIKNKLNIFAFCQIVVGILLLFIPLEIRAIKSIFQVATGEIIPLEVIFISSIIVTAPFCALLGFMFALACRINTQKLGDAAKGISSVYILETIGSIAGGAITSAILINFLNTVHIVGVLALMNVFAALLLVFFSKEKYIKKLLTILTALLIVVLISAYFLKGWDKFNDYSLKIQWKGFNVIACENSIYGNITLASKDEEISFFNNGLLLYTIPDRQTAEEAVHFALLEHQDPKDVLLVGAGVAGLAEELLKYPSAKVDYVELDPLIIKMADKYLPQETNTYLNDTRVTIKNIDGRLFVKNTQKKYDCVIMYLGDPLIAQLNRYYTFEFFKEIKNILKDGGIFSFTVSSSENYLNADLKKALQSFYGTLKKVFADVKVIPGDTACFLASNRVDLLTYDYNILAKRVSERKLDLKYVREYYLSSKLSAQRVQYLEGVLSRENRAAINYDFRPISYFYETIFHLSLFKDSLFAKIFRAVTVKKVWIVFSVFIAAILIYFLLLKNRKNFPNIFILAIGVTGFSQMAFQIIILLSFQIIYGYMFYKLGLILTFFMLGLALGALWLSKRIPKLERDTNNFIYAQLAAVIYSAVLPLFFWWQKDQTVGMAYKLGAEIFFPLFSMISGFIGGWQFSLANKICLKDNQKPGSIGGLVYGVDLCGACLGAFLVSTFLIPVIGIPNSCLMLAIANFMIFSLLLSRHDKSSPT
ncbi:MAG: fused MFS/spermidine synthase [Candidatus Omnitrophota bacterium]|nr:fused MFS/spermidine synthase [Candidatus Omnitrophota bacterium]